MSDSATASAAETSATTQGQTGMTGGTGATTSASAPAATDWTSGFNDETKGYVQNKGFKGPQDVIESYRNFEKTMGSKAEHLLKLPENMDTPEGRAIYERLGAPKDAKDYKINIPAEHGDEKLAEAFRDIAHKNSFTHKQMEGLVGWWNERTGTQIKASKEAHETMLTNANATLKKDWGAAYEQNKTIGDQAALKYGWNEKQVQALGQALGPDGAMKFLYDLGKASGEAAFVTGGAAGAGILAPSAAQAEIKALSQDPVFAKRLTSGDADAKRQWDKLHIQAAH